MKPPESIRKSGKSAFGLLMLPLLLYLMVVWMQFQSDRYQRKARSDPDDLSAAAGRLGRAVRLDPDDAEAWRNLGAVHQLAAQKETEPERRLRALGEAEAAYLAAIDSVPTESANHINLGWVRLQMDQIRGSPPRKEVMRSFQLASRLDPFNYYPHYLLGDYFLYQGKREEAFAEFHQAIRVYPHDEVIRAIIKRAMKATRDYDRLSQVIPQGIVLAHGYFAWALFEDLDNWDASKQEFQKIFKLEPRNMYYRDWYFGYCIQKGDIAAAVQEIEERAELLGDDPKVLLRVAEFLKYKGELDQAKTYCQRALKIAPDLQRALGLLAEIERDQGNLVAATKTYEDQIRLSPRDPEAYYGLALIYQRHGTPYKAAELFLQASYLAPAEMRYQMGLADTYLLLGSPDKALEALSKCKKINPGDITAYLKAGEIYLKKEDWMGAAGEFSEAIKMQPDHKQAMQGFLQAQSKIP